MVADGLNMAILHEKSLVKVVDYPKIYLLNKNMERLSIQAPWEHNGILPVEFTCDGQSNFPTIVVSDIPDKSQSLLLIIDDPDAPGGTWDHYLLANIPISGNQVTISRDMEHRACVVGQNSW